MYYSAIATFISNPMSEQPRTRQQLYDRIRETSKQEFILDEMLRLGFWAAAGEIAADPATEIRRQGEITRELQQLRQANARLQNEKQLRQDLLKQRLAESRQKQQETKARRERERIERTQKWQQQKQTEISYLGAGVSAGLNNTPVCTELEVEEVELDGKTYYVAIRSRHLPQGSPASPAITNLLCRRLDRRLTAMAGDLSFTYTRYADT